MLRLAPSCHTASQAWLHSRTSLRLCLRSLATDAAASETPAKSLESIAGTVAYHRAYILLHTRIPPPAFPARVSSKLQRQLQLRTSRWGGLVNFAWLPGEMPLSADGEGKPEWEFEDEAYRVSAYAQDRGRIDIPSLTMDNVDEVAAALQRHAEAGPRGGLGAPGQDPFYLYVCTHGERDCRCGTTGQAVFDALQEEIGRKGLEQELKVGAVGHVGGHKYAANILVYPWGDWLGNVKVEHVPRIVDQIRQARSKHSFKSDASVPPYDSGLWRGRMGLDKEEQLGLVGKEETSPENTPLAPHASRF